MNAAAAIRMQRWPPVRGINPARGFTLVELLAALTVLSLLMVALYAGLRGAVRTADSADAHQQANEAMRVTTRFVRLALEQAQPLTRWRDGKWSLVFSGENELLRFVSAMPARLGGGGLYVLTLRPAGEGDTRRLEIGRRLLHPDLDDIDDRDLAAGIADTAVLLEDLRTVQFEYYGALRAAGQPGWHTRWDDRQRMPSLVRIRIEPGNAPAWPAMVVRLHADLVRPLPRAAPGAATAPQQQPAPATPPPIAPPATPSGGAA